MGRLELARRGRKRDDEVVARERVTAGLGKERATAELRREHAITGQRKSEFHNIECKDQMNHG